MNKAVLIVVSVLEAPSLKILCFLKIVSREKCAGSILPMSCERDFVAVVGGEVCAACVNRLILAYGAGDRSYIPSAENKVFLYRTGEIIEGAVFVEILLLDIDRAAVGIEYYLGCVDVDKLKAVCGGVCLGGRAGLADDSKALDFCFVIDFVAERRFTYIGDARRNYDLL